MKAKRLIYFISLFVFVAPITTSCAPKDDFDIMRLVYKNYLVEKTDVTKMLEKGADDLYNELNKETINGVETLYYPNIDYTDGFESSNWEVADHLTYALNAAIANVKTHNMKYKKIAIGLTYYWIYHDFRSTNWWWNDLGAGARLTNVGLFIFDDLNEQGKMAFRSRIARTSFYYRPSLKTHSGANLIDYADNTLKAAIINRNPDELESSIKRIEEEITDENMEGFQKDGSFFQHGRQLQTMSNYGRSVLRIGKILHIISKTSYRFSTEKLKIITNFVLRGIASGTFKGYSNYSEVAREYSRNDTYMKAESYYDLDYFLELPNLPDREEFEKFMDNLKHHRPTFEGIMYFNDAKFVAMNLDGLYLSFKGSDPLITSTECVNGENRLGLNLSYGTNTCVMDEGDEYYHISPIWDYCYIPGTTSFQVLDYDKAEDKNQYLLDSDKKIVDVIKKYGDEIFEQLLPEEKGEIGNDFVYRSGFDEENQIAYFMQRSNSHKENDFTVTCIATKDGMFLMGADLDYDGSQTGDLLENPPIHTTIEQCFCKGSYNLSGDKKTLTHGNAMYKVYDDHEIKVRNPEQTVTGFWNRNNISDKTTEPVTGKVLLAYLDTDTNNKYAYSIQPKSYENRKFELINNFNNNEKVQEVKLPNGQLVIVSYSQVVVPYQDYYKNNHLLKKGDFIIVNPPQCN